MSGRRCRTSARRRVDGLVARGARSTRDVRAALTRVSVAGRAVAAPVDDADDRVDAEAAVSQCGVAGQRRCRVVDVDAVGDRPGHLVMVDDSLLDRSHVIGADRDSVRAGSVDRVVRELGTGC